MTAPSAGGVEQVGRLIADGALAPLAVLALLAVGALALLWHRGNRHFRVRFGLPGCSFEVSGGETPPPKDPPVERGRCHIAA